MKKLKKVLSSVAAALGTLVLLVALTNCSLFSTGSGGSTASIFAVDSKNGNVYEIDGDSLTAATSPLISVGQNAAGEIVFCGDTGFVAVGSYKNTAPGLYYFDASSETPSAKLLGATMSAQYVCIASDTKGYVSSADAFGAYTSAVYSFNPAKPSKGLGAAVSGFPVGIYPQDIVLAGGRIYVADNAHNAIYRLNWDGDTVEARFSASANGTTGLLAGNYDYDGDGDADAGVFVANTGGYDANWNPLPGSIDFIPAAAASGTTVSAVISDISVGRLAAFDDTTLVATGYSGTYLVDLSGAAPVASKVTSAGTSFGSFDVNIYDGYAYVPDGANTIYRFSSAGNDVQTITVGKTGEYVTNVGIRQ